MKKYRKVIFISEAHVKNYDSLHGVSNHVCVLILLKLTDYQGILFEKLQQIGQTQKLRKFEDIAMQTWLLYGKRRLLDRFRKNKKY